MWLDSYFEHRPIPCWKKYYKKGKKYPFIKRTQNRNIQKYIFQREICFFYMKYKIEGLHI